MNTMSIIYRGVVREGTIVLEREVMLPEGTRVKVELLEAPSAFTPEEAEEFAAWERASDAAWALIEQEEEGKTDAAR